MLLYYENKTGTKRFFDILLNVGTIAKSDILSLAVSYREVDLFPLCGPRYNSVKKRVIEDRSKALSIDVDYGDVLTYKSKALTELLAQPSGKELHELILKEGPRYAIKSKAEMRKHLRGRRPDPGGLLSAVMPVLVEYLERTAAFDVSYTRNSSDKGIKDEEAEREANEAIRLYAQEYARKIQEAINASVYAQADDLRTATSMLKMELGVANTELPSVHAPTV